MGNKSAFIRLTTSKCDGSLERLLGRVRRRGFSVESMVVTANYDNQCYQVDLNLEGFRCFETLAKHLSAIHDVKFIRVRANGPIIDYGSVDSSLGSQFTSAS